MNHQRHFVSGRKGDAWTNLYDGVDSIAAAQTLEKFRHDVAFDEIHFCFHVQPQLPIEPKVWAANVAKAKADAVAAERAEAEAQKANAIAEKAAAEAALKSLPKSK